MQNELWVAVFAGVGGMFGWGLADFFAKKTIDEVGDTTSLVWAHVFGSLSLLLITLLRFLDGGKFFSISSDFKTWSLLLFFGILQAVVYLFVYRGFGKGQVTLLNPIFASFSGITALLSILFFGELINNYLLLSLFIIFLGILILNIDFQSLKNRRISFVQVPGFKEVAVATIMAAFWTLFWDKFVGGEDWLSYTLLMYVFMTIFMYIVAKVQNVKLKITKNYVWKFLFLIGFCEILAYLAISIGYSKTSYTSVVALLSGAFSLPTIVLAKIFLKEKVSKSQAVGVGIIIFGVIVLALL